MPHLRTENLKNHTIFRGTYLYSPYMGVPPRALVAFTKNSLSYFRDSIVVSLINCMTSFFAGFTVFSMMGFMARLLKTEVGNAVKGGKGSISSQESS